MPEHPRRLMTPGANQDAKRMSRCRHLFAAQRRAVAQEFTLAIPSYWLVSLEAENAVSLRHAPLPSALMPALSPLFKQVFHTQIGGSLG